MAEGLDTRGLASGFTQGFGLMDQYYQGQAQQERADEKLNMQRERFDMEREEVERARDLETVQLALGKIANGMAPSEEEIETLRDNPKYWPALDPDTDDALAVAEQVVDPESPKSINDPDSLASLNQLFGSEVAKGEGGQKLVTGVYPGTQGDTVTLDLEVTGEDGKTYRAPMTDGRSNREDDDTVMEVPVEKLVEKTQGMKAIRKSLQTPEAQAQASKVLQLLRGEESDNWELEEHETLGMIQRNTDTGEVKPVRGGAGSADAARRGGGDDRPSRIREAELLVENGIAGDMEEAYNMVRSRAGSASGYDRAQDEINYLSDRIESINNTLQDRAAMAQIPDEDREQMRRELEELKSRRERVAQQAFPSGSGLDTGDQPEPEPEGETEEGKSSEEDQPNRERGRRPGPDTSPDERADQILNDVLG
ncbi:hypothetical protein [Halomonas sp. NO4]|uniref:hypothetical protein n=1 Tax=Halomonas sp. NO4 TaxID=2484813 RepID=UPI0013CFEC24|nr:hypothetical protein [Halomonas sp. NO4]